MVFKNCLASINQILNLALVNFKVTAIIFITKEWKKEINLAEIGNFFPRIYLVIFIAKFISTFSTKLTIWLAILCIDSIIEFT